MPDFVPITRMCGACLEETAVVGAGFQRSQIVWVCPSCGYIELSGIEEDCTLRAPSRDELRAMMGPTQLGDAIRHVQRSARLGDGEIAHAPEVLPPVASSSWQLWEMRILTLVVLLAGAAIGALAN